MSGLAPVAPRERLLTIDVLRGLALCGVLIGNMVLYSGRFTGPPSKPTGFDEVSDWFLRIVVSSKAQTLLTFLFGFGFATQLIRAQERGEAVTAMHVRRMLALFAIGALHIALLWWGDVTWTYAVAGFGMLPFLRASNRTRVLAALFLIFVPQLLTRVPEIGRPIARLFLDPPEFRAGIRRLGHAIEDASKLELTWEHLRFAAIWQARLWAWYYFWTLGRFLLGHVAGQRRWFDGDGAAHLPVFRRMALWGGLTAAAAATVDALVHLGHIQPGAYILPVQLALVAAHEVGLLATTMFYVGVVVLLMQRPTWRRMLALVAPAGRMPLTTYVAQSVFATFFLYGWGLGWARQITITGTIGLAVAIFAVEVVLAHLWLRHFRFGPLEWLWRTAVYLKPQPMRAERDAAHRGRS